MLVVEGFGFFGFHRRQLDGLHGVALAELQLDGFLEDHAEHTGDVAHGHGVERAMLLRLPVPAAGLLELEQYGLDHQRGNLLQAHGAQVGLDVLPELAVHSETLPRP
jgi:hypothetical protein